MKIGIFSDTHLGFGEGSEREGDSFSALEQAIDLCAGHGADLIVLAGDIFDRTVPSHSMLFAAVNSFSHAKNYGSQVKLTLEKGEQKKDIVFSGLPILAIHGNHEYLGKEQKTALDVLNASGHLIYFHAAKIVAAKGEDVANIFGLGAVPEKFARAVLAEWDPIAQKDCSNILLTHQGYKELMAFDDDEMMASLSLDNLPKGFDLIVNGHLHWSNTQDLAGSKFLLAGSTIPTSIKKIEAQNQKGVYIFDTNSKALEFFPFAQQRKMFYHKIVFRDADNEMVLKECRAALGADLKDFVGSKPLVRLNLKGSLKKGLSNSDINIAEIEKEYSSRVLLSISKDFSSESFRKRISELRDSHKEKLSVLSLGIQMLEKNLAETEFGGIDAKELFGLLSEGKMDEAEKLVLQSSAKK